MSNYKSLDVNHWKNIFDKVNEDDTEHYVPYSDEEFYAHQVFNLTDEQDWEYAEQIASELNQ